MIYSRRFSFFTLFLFTALILSGCAGREARCPTPEDNPQRHYVRGMELIAKGEAGSALEKFERSVYCSEDYAPGIAGRSLGIALKAKEDFGSDFKHSVVYKAYDGLYQAGKRVESDEEEFALHLATMRVYSELKPKGWFDRVAKAYKKVGKLDVNEEKLLYYNGVEAADFFMGMAYISARDFSRARDMFARVLDAKRVSRWNEIADAQWKLSDRAIRAMGGRMIADIGKEIALRESVARGAMAALLVEELRIERLFAGAIPVRSELEALKPVTMPGDIAANPFKDEILTTLKWKVRGLESFYDNASQASHFRPNVPVSRKDFALILEDVLIKLTGREEISASFFGHRSSPYPDVAVTSAWYNAVMNVTTRGLMETELSGEFRPDDPVSGVEALLAVRVLRQKMISR